ncbi:MAG: hypothetical protein GY794_00380, partial [bacterium]|nr:hypothetical protein [bacterium]
MAVVAIALLAAGFPSQSEQLSGSTIQFIALIALAGGVGICGICLMQQQIWAQRSMLIFWLIVSLSAVLTGVSALIWPEWWSETSLSKLGSPTAPLIVVGAFVAGALMISLLITTARSRLRYASLVSLSVVLAITLTVTVNVISQRDYYRIPIESLGRYSISERTEKILTDLDEPVSLTCVYTGTADGRKATNFRPRVWELLEDLREKGRKLGKRINIKSITTHSERKAEDTRLGAMQRKQHGAPHEKFIVNLHSAVGEMASQLKNERKVWQAMDKNSYLSQWPVPAPMNVRMTRMIEEFDKMRILLREELKHESIRNYPALIDPGKAVLKSTLRSLKSYSATLAAIEEVHRGAVKNRTQALESVARSVRSIDGLIAIVGKDPSPPPADPTTVIQAFIKAAATAAEITHKATVSLETIAGKKHATLVVNSSHWIIKAKNNKIALSEFFDKMSKSLLLLARRNQQILQISTTKFKSEEVLRLRKQLATMRKEFALAQTAAENALDKLAVCDAKSRKIMTDASDDKLFAGIISRAEDLLKQAGNLPELKATSLTKDLAEDNIIIVEAGGKTEVIGFDEIWPMGIRTDSQGRPRRVFNGDSSISSRICSMTNEPFATVVFAYVQPLPTVEMVRKKQIFANPVTNFNILTARLEAANFEVRQWELTKPLNESDVFGSPASRPAPKNVILIVLPSIMHAEINATKLANLKREIDNGTPAVFLAESQIRSATSPPRDMELAEYLANNWDISVLNDFVVIPAVRDDVDPTRFKIDNLRNRAMPQSNFSQHVIGKGLNGQRLLWRALSTCPLTRVSPQGRSGITVSSLLTVPASQRATWATSRFFELQAQYRTSEGSFIRPNFTAKELPDIKPPFDLAVTATREGNSATREKPNRIVALGMATSLVDSYVGANVQIHGQGGTTSLADPPGMNSDLVVNSVLWLGGLQDRIAPGPAVSKPINVQPHTRDMLMYAFAIALPLLVLAAGVCVMLTRKRS